MILENSYSQKPLFVSLLEGSKKNPNFEFDNTAIIIETNDFVIK